MTESIVNQDTLDNADYLSTKKETIKKGRKERLSVERFLDVVKRKKSLEDSVIAEIMGMNRTSIWKWKKRHPESVENAERILNEIENIRFDNSLSVEVFKNIPTIKDWIENMRIKLISKSIIRKRVNVMYDVCIHLKTHIDKLSLDQVSELVKDVRMKQLLSEKVKKGLSYYSIRKPIRAFFMQVKGISGELLTIKGITAEKCDGWGSQAKEKVTIEQRKMLPEKIREVILECFKPNQILREGRILKYDGDIEDVVLEFQTIDYFMYYTATRINATLNI